MQLPYFKSWISSIKEDFQIEISLNTKTLNPSIKTILASQQTTSTFIFIFPCSTCVAKRGKLIVTHFAEYFWRSKSFPKKRKTLSILCFSRDDATSDKNMTKKNGGWFLLYFAIRCAYYKCSLFVEKWVWRFIVTNNTFLEQ